MKALNISNNAEALAVLENAALKTAPTLQSIHSIYLNLSNNRISGPMALAVLNKAPELQILHLNLSGTSIKDVGQTLEVLNEAPKLHTLHLDLERNGIKVVALQNAPRLISLHLNLRNNHITDAGALAVLHKPTELQTLHLNLSGNHIKNVQALAQLQHALHLRTLRINLGNNNIKDAQPLAQLQHALRLLTLHLNLEANSLKQHAALAALGNAPVLRTLHLNLSWNRGCIKDARALVALCNVPNLYLNLSGNCIKAEALAMLKKDLQPHTLKLSRIRVPGSAWPKGAGRKNTEHAALAHKLWADITQAAGNIHNMLPIDFSVTLLIGNIDTPKSVVEDTLHKDWTCVDRIVQAKERNIICALSQAIALDELWILVLHLGSRSSYTKLCEHEVIRTANALEALSKQHTRSAKFGYVSTSEETRDYVYVMRYDDADASWALFDRQTRRCNIRGRIG